MQSITRTNVLQNIHIHEHFEEDRNVTGRTGAPYRLPITRDCCYVGNRGQEACERYSAELKEVSALKAEHEMIILVCLFALLALCMLLCNHYWRKRTEMEIRTALLQDVVPHWNKSAQQENFCLHCERGVARYNQAGKAMRVDCDLQCECKEFSRKKEQGQTPEKTGR